MEDYYITTGEIARQWNEDGYLTKTGCIWDPDKIIKKFRGNEKRQKVVLEKKLFEDLEKAIDSVMRVKEDLNRKIKQITVEYSEKNYREIMENVNASCKEEVVGKAMDVISGLAKRKGEFGDELEEDYFNIIT